MMVEKEDRLLCMTFLDRLGCGSVRRRGSTLAPRRLQGPSRGNKRKRTSEKLSQGHAGCKRAGVVFLSSVIFMTIFNWFLSSVGWVLVARF
jgi:hypothetical protein